MEKSKPASPYKTVTHEQLQEALPYWVNDTDALFPTAQCIGDVALALADQASEKQHNEEIND